jgi:hypothetical protein
MLQASQEQAARTRLEATMSDVFERRVRAAAVAGWWVVLIAAALLLLSWIAYLVVIAAEPAWLLSLLGPQLDWAFVQKIWFWALVVFKMSVWLMALVALWLTLWARQLRK